MKPENLNNQEKNGQKKKPELNLNEEVRKFFRVENRVKAKKNHDKKIGQEQEEENELMKRPESEQNMIRKAARTFLRVKNRVEEKKNKSRKQSGNKRKGISHLEEWAEQNIMFIEKNKSGNQNNMGIGSKHLTTRSIGLSDILYLLIEASDSNALPEDVITTCKQLNMSQIKYINFDNDPLFSSGYNFIFNYDYRKEGRLEIVEVYERLLQTGFQIIYNSWLFSNKMKNDFLLLRRLLVEHYKNEFEQKLPGVKIYNFANDLSQCYLSKSRININLALNFKIMNKENWSLATLFGKD